MLPDTRMLKGARIVLGWTQSELAERAKVSLHTVFRAEAGKDSRRSTIEAIVEALQAGGIHFLPATGSEGEGIRLRPKQNPSDPEEQISDSSKI